MKVYSQEAYDIDLTACYGVQKVERKDESLHRLEAVGYFPHGVFVFFQVDLSSSKEFYTRDAVEEIRQKFNKNFQELREEFKR